MIDIHINVDIHIHIYIHIHIHICVFAGRGFDLLVDQLEESPERVGRYKKAEVNIPAFYNDLSRKKLFLTFKPEGSIEEVLVAYFGQLEYISLRVKKRGAESELVLEI